MTKKKIYKRNKLGQFAKSQTKRVKRQATKKVVKKKPTSRRKGAPRKKKQANKYLTNISRKLLALALIIGLNGVAISHVGYTSGYYNDVENSGGNIFAATSLNFSLNSPADFTPEVTPESPDALRTISVSNDGGLGFQYTASTTNPTGVLCSFLNLVAKLDGVEKYNGPLNNFNVGSFVFGETENWDFTATLASSAPELEGTTCEFDFLYGGWQDDLPGPFPEGFNDVEIIHSIINAGGGEETCPAPKNPDMDVPVSFGTSSGQDEPSVQEFFDDEGFAIDADNDQKNYQVWEVDNDVQIEVEAKYLGSFAGYAIVFGYYTDNDPTNFVGLWKTKPRADFSSLPVISAGIAITTSFTASSNVSFGINALDLQSGATYFWKTETAQNSDGKRHAVVYDFAPNEYLLAFEDLPELGDSDYNDLITKVSFPDCDETDPDESGNSVGDIVINEIMWMGSFTEAHDEWIELRNTTTNEIDISGWKIIEAGSGAGASVTIPSGKTIPANGFFLIGNYASDNSNSAVSNSIAVDYVTTGISLNNGGEQLTLKDTGETVIDQTPSTSWVAGTDSGSTRKSMERNAVPSDGTIGGNWHTCVASGCNDTTFWDVEDKNYGTPRAVNLSENDSSIAGAIFNSLAAVIPLSEEVVEETEEVMVPDEQTNTEQVEEVVEEEVAEEEATPETVVEEPASAEGSGEAEEEVAPEAVVEEEVVTKTETVEVVATEETPAVIEETPAIVEETSEVIETPTEPVPTEPVPEPAPEPPPATE